MSAITKDSLLLKTRIRRWNNILKNEGLLAYDMSESRKTAKSVSAFLKDCIIKNRIDVDLLWNEYLKSDYKLVVELLNEFRLVSNRYNHNKILSAQKDSKTAKSASQTKEIKAEKSTVESKDGQDKKIVSAQAKEENLATVAVQNREIITEKDKNFALQSRKKIIKNLKALANEYRGVNQKEFEKIDHILADLNESDTKPKKSKTAVQRTRNIKK